MEDLVQLADALEIAVALAVVGLVGWLWRSSAKAKDVQADKEPALPAVRRTDSVS